MEVLTAEVEPRDRSGEIAERFARQRSGVERVDVGAPAVERGMAFGPRNRPRRRCRRLGGRRSRPRTSPSAAASAGCASRDRTSFSSPVRRCPARRARVSLSISVKLMPGRRSHARTWASGLCARRLPPAPKTACHRAPAFDRCTGWLSGSRSISQPFSLAARRAMTAVSSRSRQSRTSGDRPAPCAHQRGRFLGHVAQRGAQARRRRTRRPAPRRRRRGARASPTARRRGRSRGNPSRNPAGG